MSDRIGVLDKGYVRLLDRMGDDLAVCRAARVLADADWRGEPDRRLLRYMMRHGHTSPFEQVVLKFEVKAPIAVFRQWHRHRTQSPNEISARYAPLPEEFYVMDVELIGQQARGNHQSREIVAVDGETWARREAQVQRYIAHCDGAFALYRELLDDGWPREVARLCLPLSTYSRMIVTANLHNWFRFLRERLATEAQYEIRAYAEAILALIEPLVPVCVAAWREGRP